MKKLLAMLLVLSMVLGLLCGCDSDSSSTRKKRSEREDNEEVEEVQEELEVTVEETVVYDDADVKITVTGLKEGYSGPEIKLLVENYTDRDIAVSGDFFIVNGITISGWAYIEVAAGKKANDVISFYSYELEQAGIEYLATVVCPDMHVIDVDSYDTLAETPFEIETSLAGEYVQPLDEDGDVLFQENGVTVIAKNVVNDDMGTGVVLLVKNDTGKVITVEADNVSVNDFTIDAWMYDRVYADTVRFCTLNIYSSSLEENGITDIETVTFKVAVWDSYSYDEICESGELLVTVD